MSKPLPPQHRIVLDWLCRQPAQVFDFADVADQLKMKRGEIEKVIGDLRHQRFGALLALRGPDGLKLRDRHAYLPHASPARAGYAPVPELPATAAEHPTITAMKKAQVEAKEQAARAEVERKAEIAQRGAIHEAFRKRKLDARAKVVESRRAELDHRYHTGYAEPLGPAPVAPPVPSAVAAPVAVAAPAPLLVEEPLAPTVAYKKKGPK